LNLEVWVRGVILPALCVGTMFISVIFARYAIHPIENTNTIQNIHIIHIGTIHYSDWASVSSHEGKTMEGHVIAKDKT
jgi:hypothetical protein